MVSMEIMFTNYNNNEMCNIFVTGGGSAGFMQKVGHHSKNLHISIYFTKMSINSFVEITTMRLHIKEKHLLERGLHMYIIQVLHFNSKLLIFRPKIRKSFCKYTWTSALVDAGLWRSRDTGHKIEGSTYLMHKQKHSTTQM